MAVDPGKLEQFVGKAIGDLGAALSAALVVIGDKLGLYKAMADAGPLLPAELAGRTATAERYVREWLNAQAAAGYVNYDANTGRYFLSEEQAVALVDESSPACVLGGFQAMTAAMKAEPKISEGFRTGRGVGWHEHDPGLFQGTERFFRPGYAANLVSAWIPALDDVEAKLQAGARVADVGCGHGVSTMLMARAYPKSTVVGFDYHAPSIERARQLATEAGLGERATFADHRHMIIYGQRTADDRIAFGGRGAPYHYGSAVHSSFDNEPRVHDLLRRTLAELFPAVAQTRFTHAWGGPLGIPRDWHSSVGYDRQSGLAWAGGYVGDGVATTNLAGRTLADLVTGVDSPLTALPWVSHRSPDWEPEPLRWLGVNAGLVAMRLADRSEVRRGRPSRLAGAMGRLLGH